jgi:DNA-binding MarR family transcriptional regulator
LEQLIGLQGVMKHLNLIPALIIVARHNGDSISNLIDVLRAEGVGGYRACRKLIYRLEKLGLLGIGVGTREDRREKSVGLTEQAQDALRSFKEYLSQF